MSSWHCHMLHCLNFVMADTKSVAGFNTLSTTNLPFSCRWQDAKGRNLLKGQSFSISYPQSWGIWKRQIYPNLSSGGWDTLTFRPKYGLSSKNAGSYISHNATLYSVSLFFVDPPFLTNAYIFQTSCPRFVTQTCCCMVLKGLPFKLMATKCFQWFFVSPASNMNWSALNSDILINYWLIIDFIVYLYLLILLSMM